MNDKKKLGICQACNSNWAVAAANITDEDGTTMQDVDGSKVDFVFCGDCLEKARQLFADMRAGEFDWNGGSRN
jgi:hypothetical protein